MFSIIPVKVIPRAKVNRVKSENGTLKVYLAAPPIEGKANKLLMELLADYFNCRKSQLRIIKGEKARNKIIEFKKGDR